MTEQFVTQEVGSIRKPEWRVKAISGGLINGDDIRHAIIWGEQLGIDSGPLVDILTDAQSLEPGVKMPVGERNYVRNAAALYAVRLQESAGLDVVYDGEQDRVEMYEHAIKHTRGFEFRGRVRAFDDNYYLKAAIVGKPAIDRPWHTAELERLQGLTDRQIKVPITGAYTLGAWSYDEFYNSEEELGDDKTQKGARLEAREELVMDLATNVLRPNIEALIAGGAKLIQIDEPAATTVPNEVALFVKAFNASTRGLSGAEFSTHICFSDYNLLFPYIQEMEGCAEYSLEFANKDSRKPGITDDDRPAYQVLQRFVEHDIPGRIGLGVVEIHSQYDEPVELVRDRILYVAGMLKDPSRIRPQLDCGARPLPWEVAYRKMLRVVEGSRQAEQILL